MQSILNLEIYSKYYQHGLDDIFFSMKLTAVLKKRGKTKVYQSIQKSSLISASVFWKLFGLGLCWCKT